MRARKQRRPERPRRSRRPPLGELMRVVRHLAELSGEPLDGERLMDRCRALLADPAAARRLLETFDLTASETDGEE